MRSEFKERTMSFAQNIQYLRKLRGITQEELSDLVGVSRQSVSKWETGDAFPETEKIMQLCDIFNVSMDVPCAATHKNI